MIRGADGIQQNQEETCAQNVTDITDSGPVGHKISTCGEMLVASLRQFHARTRCEVAGYPLRSV